MIEVTEKKIKKLNDLKTATMNELLANGIGHSKYKDSEVGRIPESWEIIRLTDICTPTQWPTISKSELTKSGYPVFGANGYIGFYSDYNHETETIAITCRGATCGTVNLIPGQTYITGNSMCIENLNIEVSQKFLFYALKNISFDRVITGSAQPQITAASLRNIVILRPNFIEQTAIANHLTQLDQLIAETQRRNEKLQLVKKGLMEDLLTGKVRVKVEE